jgi:predicted nucleic acid-binding protein
MIAFVDTGAWIAAQVQHDPHHQHATAYFRDPPGRTRLVTSNAVIGEVATWLVYHGYRAQALLFRDRISGAERAGLVRISWVTREIHTRAWDILERFDDQTFSFLDCTSIAIARDIGADYVVGFDTDFVIAGFELRP